MTERRRGFVRWLSPKKNPPAPNPNRRRLSNSHMCVMPRTPQSEINQESVLECKKIACCSIWPFCTHFRTEALAGYKILFSEPRNSKGRDRNIREEVWKGGKHKFEMHTFFPLFFFLRIEDGGSSAAAANPFFFPSYILPKRLSVRH